MLFSVVCIVSLLFTNKVSSTLIPNSCIGLPDGTHWLKLINDDAYPLVLVECSNEFMIIDVKKDPNLKKYFSSWAMWHYGIAGPVNDDPVNWDDWYLPSKYDISSSNENQVNVVSNKIAKHSDVESGDDFVFEGQDSDEDDSDVDTTTQYIVSSDCSVCEKTNKDTFSGKATYMTGNLYGCFWYVRGLHDCDMDWDTYECFYCLCDSETCSAVKQSQLTDIQKQHTSTGTCATITKKVDFEVAPDHDVCYF